MNRPHWTLQATRYHLTPFTRRMYEHRRDRFQYIKFRVDKESPTIEGAAERHIDVAAVAVASIDVQIELLHIPHAHSVEMWSLPARFVRSCSHIIVTAPHSKLNVICLKPLGILWKSVLVRESTLINFELINFMLRFHGKVSNVWGWAIDWLID